MHTSLAPDSHSEHVAQTACDLFRILHPVHQLGERELVVLRTGAELHDIGWAEGQEFHHTASRRMIMERELPGLSEEERSMAALAAGYHRKKVLWREDEELARLPKGKRDAVLVLAGLLRIADGLDYSHEHAAVVVGACQRRKRSRLVVKHEGAFASMDIARANKKADLWEERALKPIRVEMWVKNKKRKRTPVVCAYDPVPEAARKIMLFHFDVMVAHEEGTKAGEDIEELHDMRVASRRLRSAFRLFRKPLSRELLEPFQDDLRWLGRTLGTVRDLDVGMAYMSSIQSDAAGDESDAIRTALEQMGVEREAARAPLLAGLDSDRYRGFKERFGEFLLSPWLFAKCPGYGAAVADFVPALMSKRLKRVRSYRELIDNATAEDLHALRIDCKRLRYAAEFVRHCYPRSLQGWVGKVVEVQTALGEIHDRDVRVPALQAMADRQRHSSSLAAGFDGLIGRELTKRQDYLETFHELWPRVSSKKFRKQLQSILSEPR